MTKSQKYDCYTENQGLFFDIKEIKRMKLHQFGLPATLLTIASILSIAAPVKAANIDTSDHNPIEISQRVGERPGDTCRMVVESSILYVESDSTSTQMANMLEDEMVNLMATVTAEDGTVWFHIEDSVGNMGYMPAYMSGTRLANLSYCTDTPTTFPAAW
jgi:hypothetical protein